MRSFGRIKGTVVHGQDFTYTFAKSNVRLLQLTGHLRCMAVDGTETSVSTYQCSEQGNLNLTFPRVPPNPQITEHSSDQY